MKTLLAVATVALAAATFAADSKGGQRKDPPGGMKEGPSDPIVRLVTNPKMAEKIGLTEDQQKQIKEINTTNRESSEDLRRSLRESMKKQTELLKADKIDEAAVMAEIDKAFDVRKELAKRQTKRIIAIKSILTPEQIAKALEEIKNRQNRERDKRKAKEKGPKDKRPDGDKPHPPKEDDDDKPCSPDKED